MSTFLFKFQTILALTQIIAFFFHFANSQRFLERNKNIFNFPTSFYPTMQIFYKCQSMAFYFLLFLKMGRYSPFQRIFSLIPRTK